MFSSKFEAIDRVSLRSEGQTVPDGHGEEEVSWVKAKILFVWFSHFFHVAMGMPVFF